MEILVLKVVLTPALIAAASLAARRWGHAVSGWLVGLPLTSGPIAFFLALERGTSFAAVAAVGSLAGAIAETAFCVAYAGVAARARRGQRGVRGRRRRLPATGVVDGDRGRGACVSLVIALRFVPRGAGRAAMPSPPRWDLPARMIIATALVLVITELAPAIGPRWSGVLATFPVYAAILTVFAHRGSVAAAVEVLRGLLLGLFAFAAFFVILGALIERAGVATAFAAAILSALAIQAASFALAVRS